MSKLTTDTLAKALSNGLKPVYLVSGDESLLVYESCAQIKRQAKSEGYTQHDICHAEAGFNWDELLQNANALSLFAEKKTIELRIANGKPGDKGGKALRAYCDNPPQDTILIVVAPRLDVRKPPQWLKAVLDAGDHLIIWPVEAEHLPRWVEKRLYQHGLSAHPDAIALLCAKIEGNLLAAAQEVEKLKLLATDKYIDEATMIASVMDSSRYTPFDLADKALAGDARSAIACLSGLKAEGTSAPVLLWSLTKQVRMLLELQEKSEAGQPADTRQMRLRKKSLALLQGATRRTHAAEMRQLLRQCVHAEKVIKGVASGDQWNELLDITLGLCGVKALNARSQKTARLASLMKA